ncbi:MAG: hypothetical protein HY363_06280 [Candidatus Aenigmarchaeota archaeon]|nr:hypothetical protein [Candidatus Aenigmarchaeota archaeon]
MTTLLLDADSLIKLTKAGAKEYVTNSFDVVVPQKVKQETVDAAKGKPDALVIQQNIQSKQIKVVDAMKVDKYLEREINQLHLQGGEQEVYALSNDYDILSSDDQRFLRLLQMLNKKAVTPASIIVLLYKKKKISKECVRALLRNIRPFVSDEEHDLCINEIRGNHDNNS